MTGNRTPGRVRETIMRTRMGIIAALLLTVGLVGCGGNDGDDGVASANGSTGSPTSSASSGSGSERDKALRYAQCMRENGVPKFPDPDEGFVPEPGNAKEIAGSFGVDRDELGVDWAKFDAAHEKCRRYLPNGGVPQQPDPEAVEQKRQYAQCMRENGVPTFPDPSADGRFQIDPNEIDRDSPTYKAADEKCNDEVGPRVGEVPAQSDKPA